MLCQNEKWVALASEFYKTNRNRYLAYRPEKIMERKKQIMDFFEVVSKRRSIRNFRSQPVENDKIDQMLSAVLRAPSAQGSKPWEFVVVTDPDLLDKLSRAKSAGAGFIKKAPLAVVVCADPAKSVPWVEDGAIVAAYCQLAAQAVGLGSCWSQLRDRDHDDTQSSRDYVAGLLNLPDALNVMCIIAVGYADEEKPAYSQDELAFDKISYNQYGARKA